ncbi:general stress protein [Phosphitispora sp. TUW77]|uniref:general stress protein n=1 Tax=Phosphitispora sp. TUW77 TaxID=3152361 RepID=UPI003AB3B6A5
MSKTVISTFSSRAQAEKAVSDLRNKGFEHEISIVAKDESGTTAIDRNSEMYGGDSITDGTAAGGMLGGIAGLALGAGAMAIPGLGPVIAAGPIAGLFSGAATGGIAGGLTDWGIPEDRGNYYEGKLKEGNIVAAIKTDDNKVSTAASVLRSHGAQDVETH